MFRVVLRTITWSLLVTSVAMRSALAGGVRTPSLVDLETQEILATGDDVPGFGTIGEAGFQLLGVDDGGRVLIRGEVSDGRHGFYWVDGEQITPIWVAGESLPSLAHIWGALTPVSVSRNGNIVTLVREASGALAVYAIEPTGARRIVGTGDVVDEQGHRVCALLDYDDQFAQLAINDAGSVAFVAWIGSDCGAFRDEDYCDRDGTACLPSAVFVTSGTTLRKLEPGVRAFQLRGVARDGTVVLDEQAATGWFTVRVSPAGARQPLDPADFGLVREWSSPADGRVAMSDDGEVAFVASNGGQPALYRTVRDRIVQVVKETDLPTREGTSTNIEAVALNDNGDVLVRTVSYSPTDRETRSLLFYDAQSDMKRSVGGDLVTGIVAQALNNSGLAAYAYRSISSYDHPARSEIVRWGNGSFDHVLASGAAAPDGGEFAVRGLLDVACLAGDGTIVSGAMNLEGQHGLVCADANGSHTVMRSGDAAPEGGAFDDVQGCTVAGPGDVFFLASHVPGTASSNAGGEPAIYRASSIGIERMAGVGEPTGNGAMITSLRGLSVNANGHLLTYGTTPSGSGLFLRRNGALEPIVAEGTTVGARDRIAAIHEFALTDDDEVLFSAILGNQCCLSSLLAWRDGVVRVLARAGEPILSSGPVDGFRDVEAHGRFALFTAQTDGYPLIRYDAEAGQMRHVIASGDALLHGGWPQGAHVLANGDVGVPYYFSDEDSNVHRGFVLLRAGDAQDVRFTAAQESADTIALAFNERGNALLRSHLSAEGAARYALLLAGAASTGSGCPTNRTLLPAAPLLPTPTATATPAFASASPTRSPGSGAVEIEIEPVTASPGSRAEIRVVLHDGGNEVAGTQNDLAFAPGIAIAATADGAPDCSVNPDINKPNTAYVFLPNGCEPGPACTGLRALVISIRNTLSIPDGSLLYTCRIDIASDAAPGTYELLLSNLGAGTPEGAPIDTIGHGEIVVDVPAADRALGESSPSADGCQVQPSNSATTSWWLLTMSGLWIWRSRQCAGRKQRPL